MSLWWHSQEKVLPLLVVVGGKYFAPVFSKGGHCPMDLPAGPGTGLGLVGGREKPWFLRAGSDGGGTNIPSPTRFARLPPCQGSPSGQHGPFLTLIIWANLQRTGGVSGVGSPLPGQPLELGSAGVLWCLPRGHSRRGQVNLLLLLILSLSSSQRCSGQSHKSPISMLELAEPWEIHCTEMQHLPF